MIEAFLSLDRTLTQVVDAYGALVYILLFAVIFLETGIVVAPFLPGDSLLFAAGALASAGVLNVWLLLALLFAAAVLGDLVNFIIGTKIGTALIRRGRLWKFQIREEHVRRTRGYFDRWGGKTVVFARFIPIARTVAPFMAGVGQMPYRRFAFYNIIGAFIWVFLFVPAGYFFGSIPAVRENFEWVIIGIVGFSFVPPLIHYWRERTRA